MRNKVIALLPAAFLAGFLLFIGLRMIFVQNHAVHYHANFAVFVDGTREKFDNFTYYEEVAACSSSEENNPKHNVHMHDKKNDLVHVHAPAVTWGSFFANLGYTVANKVLVTENGTYLSGQDDKKLQFILNGEPIESVQNRVINSEDALLISYGNVDSKGLDEQYKQIAHTAAEQNTKPDPAACSGSKGLTFMDRLKGAFDFTK